MTGLAGAFLKYDIFLFTLINNRLHYRFLDRYFGLVTYIGSTPFTIIVACACLYFIPATGERIAINLIVSQLIIHSLKRIINRARPYHIMECNLVYSPPECIFSFPSGHSGASLSVALVLSTAFPTLSPIFFGLAYSVAISRIYLGYHFVSDVAAGLVIAYLTFEFLPVS